MSKLPLRDRLVVLTRPEGRGADWKDALVEAGAAVSELPLLEITFEPDDTVLSEVLDAMGEYDWIVFTSANGVRGFFDPRRRKPCANTTWTATSPPRRTTPSRWAASS
jgi:uroporphyrinogen-III synthase